VRATDVKFLAEATVSLVECRRTLAYSYVYGFYLGKNAPQRLLFEYLQEDLEKYCNHLHGLYEKPLESITDFPRWKEEIANCIRVTMKFLENFNAGVAAGLTS
jgi:ariadne-1